VSQRYVHKYGYDVSEQEWETREKNGQIITTTADGVTTSATYKKGVLTKKQPINRKDLAGKKQGLWMRFHSNMNIAEEGPYTNDLKNGFFGHTFSTRDAKYANGVKTWLTKYGYNVELKSFMSNEKLESFHTRIEISW
jgi:hypothetical protein